MRKKFLTTMLAATVLCVGFISCNNEDEMLDGGGSAAIKAGDPTTMQLTVTMPRAPQTYASTDDNATDSEVALKTVNVLIYAQASDGAYFLEKDGNKSFTTDKFEPMEGKPDTYKLTTPLSTFTGKKKIFVAMNYPAKDASDQGVTLTTLSEGSPLDELDAINLFVYPQDRLTANGFVMCSETTKDADLVRVGDAEYDSKNKLSLPVKRLVAKFTVQEKLARTNGKIEIDGGVLSDLKFAVGHQNKYIYAKQKLVGTPAIVQDPNWETFTKFNFYDINIAKDYFPVDAEGTETLALKTVYAAENTAKTYELNGANATYISVRAKYIPPFFVDANGDQKADPMPTIPVDFYTVVKSDGSVLYFNAENDADTYAKANQTTYASYLDAFCFFRAYINPNGTQGEDGIQANPYDVIRNHYYKLMINSIKVPGASSDKGDIKDKTTMDVDITLNPWENVSWDIDLE